MPSFFLLLAVAVNLVWLSPAWATEPERINWQQIGRGLGLAQLEVHHGGRVAATVTAVRIDPNFNAFRLFHGLPRTITDWQQETGALIMVNGGYFTSAGAPVGLVISDGVFFGPSRNPAMKGMFVAEPKGVSPRSAPGHYSRSPGGDRRSEETALESGADVLPSAGGPPGAAAGEEY